MEPIHLPDDEVFVVFDLLDEFAGVALNPVLLVDGVVAQFDALDDSY